MNDNDKWICPSCTSRNIKEINSSKDLWQDKEIMFYCTDCKQLFIRKYKFIETIKLNREEK